MCGVGSLVAFSLARSGDGDPEVYVERAPAVVEHTSRSLAFLQEQVVYLGNEAITNEGYYSVEHLTRATCSYAGAWRRFDCRMWLRLVDEHRTVCYRARIRFTGDWWDYRMGQLEAVSCDDGRAL